jgi:hypothetical protein
MVQIGLTTYNFDTITLLNYSLWDYDMFIAKLDTSCGFAVTTNNSEICIGDSAVITAYNALHYIWNTGNTTASITVFPMITQTYTVTGTVNGCTSSANATVIVDNYLQPVINILASPNYYICTGTPVIFTVLPYNGGSNPTFQWFKNNIPVGYNSYTYVDSTLAEGDSVFCQMTSSLICTSVNPVISNKICTHVYPKPPTPVVTQSCDTFYSSTISGNQWYNELSQIIAGATNQYYIPTEISGYYVIVTDSNGCHSDSSNHISPSFPVSINIVASPNPTCFEDTINFNATPVNSGSSPIYQWYINNIAVGQNNIYFSENYLHNNDSVF